MARAVHLHLPAVAPLMLAMGTWLLYVADRLLDGLLIRQQALLRERHIFHLRHRNAFLLAAACDVVALTVLALHFMPGFVFRAYLVLAGCALIYLLAVHMRPHTWLRPLPLLVPKELAVGLIFAAAVGLPTWERLRSSPADPSRTLLLLLLLLFAALCTLNCIAIETWEVDPDPNPDRVPERSAGNAAAFGRQIGLHPLTSALGRHLTPVALLLAGMAAIVAGFLFIFFHNEAAMALSLGLGLSALAFAALDRRRSSIPPLALRIAADTVLLTPLLILPVLR